MRSVAIGAGTYRTGSLGSGDAKGPISRSPSKSTPELPQVRVAGRSRQAAAGAAGAARPLLASRDGSRRAASRAVAPVGAVVRSASVRPVASVGPVAAVRFRSAPASLRGGPCRSLAVGAPRLAGGPLLAHLGLAVGADAPLRIKRLVAVAARIAQPAFAVGAAQIAALDRVLAMRARLLDPLPQLELGSSQLKLSFLAVLQVLRRAQDRVDDRPQVRERATPPSRTRSAPDPRSADGRRGTSSRSAPDRRRSGRGRAS